MHGAYVGLDVHKKIVAIAVAEPGRQEQVYEGEIANAPHMPENTPFPLTGGGSKSRIFPVMGGTEMGSGSRAGFFQ